MAGGSFFEGVRTGQALMDNRANQRRADIELDLRYQQLKSQEALRRVQERAAVQAMAFELEKHDLAVQARADSAKAMNRAQWESSPIMMIPNPMGGGMMPVPNPKPKSRAHAMVDNLAPIAAQYGGPEAAMNVLKDASMMQASEAMALERRARTGFIGQARPLAPENARLAEERTRTEIAKQKELESRSTRGPTYAPTDTQKNLAALAEAETKKDTNAIQALRNQLKLDGLGEMDMIKFRSELSGLNAEQLISPEEKEKRRAAIYEKYDRIAGTRRSETKGNGSADEVVRIGEGGRRAIFNSRTKEFIRYAD